MARIAFCANTAWNLANFRYPIIEALLARGDEVVIVAGYDDAQRQLEQMGCEVINVSVDAKGTNPLRDLALQFWLRRQYARLKPDIILNFTIKPVIYSTLAARALNIPVINTITGLGTAFIEDTWITRVVEKLYRKALPGSRRVIFQNKDDLTLFQQRGLLGNAATTVVPGSGVDLEEFGVVPVPRQGPVTFLLIARLLRDKGVMEFVQAARELKAHYPDARFQLLGPLGVANRTAIAEAELKQWVADGIIEYLGSTDDVRPHIAKAHCVVLPSYREGMPRVLLEAASMGRPLIATDVTGCREVVTHGVNGYLCVARVAGDLAFKMRSFIELPYKERQKMGTASRALAEDRFDVRKVVDTYLELIDKTI